MSSTPSAVSPFHAGEQAMQARAGLRDRLEATGRVAVRDHMPDQHRELFTKLPTLLLGSLDAAGRPWATMLHGAPGFVASPDARTLRLDTPRSPDDPALAGLVEGAPVGLLGLQPSTRRRNRANGRLRAVTPSSLDVEVRQSFGNCPKYIHAREPHLAADAAPAAPARRLDGALDDATRALLRRADTLFIASASGPRPADVAGEGVDVSHRGGRPGFLRLEDDDASGDLHLTLPDYQGNFFFNTLGNLLAWPRAGLLVPDFDDGSLLHLAVDATIDDDPAAVAAFEGAQRLVRLRVREAVWRPGALPLRWSVPLAPPQFA